MLGLATLAPAPARAAASSVGYTEPKVAGVTVRLVTVDLNDPDVRIDVLMGRNRVGAAESFSSMMKRARPDAAITGTFFGTTTLLPTGSIVVDGRQIWAGGIGTGVAFGPKNRVRFVDTKQYRQAAWDGYRTVIQGGPRLVRKGRVWVDPRAEGFRDGSLFTPRIRTALGWRRDGKLLLATVSKPVYLRTLAQAMRKLGAYEAVALDGGSSTGLYYRGSYVAKPQRMLTNVITVYANPRRYANVAPHTRPRVASVM